MPLVLPMAAPENPIKVPNEMKNNMFLHNWHFVPVNKHKALFENNYSNPTSMMKKMQGGIEKFSV